MNKKEIDTLDKILQYLSESADRISKIRVALNINPHYNFFNEIKTIESLYFGVLEDRKKFKDTYIFASTSGWTVEYFRNKKTYKKNEKFKLKISFCFVDEDNFDD